MTGTAPAKKRVRGADKQPRKKKTQIEKRRAGETAAEIIKGAKDTVVRQRGFKALREALINKDIKNSK